MKIKMLKDGLDATKDKIYEAEVDDDTIIFLDDVGYERAWCYPDDRFYIEVEGEVINEPEQLTLRDQFAIAALATLSESGYQDHYIAISAYRIADAMMEARKK